jgi:hypothetical protein
VNFGFSDKVKGLQHRLQAFLDEHIYPNEQCFHDETEENRWPPTKIVEFPLCNPALPSNVIPQDSTGECNSRRLRLR